MTTPGVSLDDELPVSELPDDPRWLENFCFDGYDHVRNVGYWIHCGRWWRDPRIWREQVQVYWPDGRYAVHRGFGARASEQGVSSALLDLRCLDAGKRWRLGYRGPVRMTDSMELQRGALPEGPQELLDFDVTFDSARPVWHMAGIGGEKWAHFHFEQTGRVTGSIRLGGEATAIDGAGWRDHSRGPRNLSSMGRHCWIHGELSRGRSFALTAIDNRIEGRMVRGLDKVVIWEGGELHPARCLNPPFLQNAQMPVADYEMTLEYAGGHVAIQAEVRRCLPHSTGAHMDCFDGITPSQAHVVTFEQGTVFSVDGERFDGHTERSFLLQT